LGRGKQIDFLILAQATGKQAPNGIFLLNLGQNKIVMKIKLLLLPVLFLFCQTIVSQKITKMKTQGKNYIIKQALEFLNEEGVNTSEIANKNAKVMADDNTIFVHFLMGFQYKAKENVYKTYVIYVGFSDNGTQVNYGDYNPDIRKYKLTRDDERKVNLALMTKNYWELVETGCSYEIKEYQKYFEVTYQLDDAARCYQIDRTTRKVEELWHEHLEPMPIENLIEIKE
jgi:hypothetical protein